MKLVNKDAGTRANGARTLNYIWSGMESNSSRATLYRHSTIRSVGLRLASDTLRPRALNQKSQMQTN